MKKTLIITILLGFIFQAVAGGNPDVESGEDAGLAKKPDKILDPELISSGKSIFHSTCADFCHGHEPALFIDREGLDPDYVYQTIRDGGKGATPMPPWGDVFTPEEIWELVAYVLSLGQYTEE